MISRTGILQIRDLNLVAAQACLANHSTPALARGETIPQFLSKGGIAFGIGNQPDELLS
nr:hypothetical protein [Synechococcus sp. CS-1328]